MQTRSVGEVTQHIKSLLEGDLLLAAVAVRGEITGCRPAPSGHIYFTLKDPQAQLRAVVWRAQRERLGFVPRDGQQVIALGRLGVYESRGEYQLNISQLRPDGVGDLNQAFQLLKERLQAEGLFDEARKRPICPLPRRLGLVTSRDGAALKDMLVTLQQRHPGVDVVLSSSLVQGAEAPASLQNALRRLWRLHEQGTPIDTIIVARGGGALEDLQAFNDEAWVRLLATSPIPVICGVGHETDFTLSDFVADCRAATPTAAAQRAVPLRHDLVARSQDLEHRLRQALASRMQGSRLRFEALRQRLQHQHPVRRLEYKRQDLDLRQQRLEDAYQRILERRRARLQLLATRLEALSPLRVLARGYAVCRTPDQGVLHTVTQVHPGDPFEVCLPDGRIQAQVVRVYEQSLVTTTHPPLPA